MKKNVQSPKDANAVAVQFGANQAPALEAGTYTLAVEQTLSYSGSVDDPAIIAPYSIALAVQGDRFALDPSLIVGSFPAEGSCGEFGDSLPFATLSHPTLPWYVGINADGSSVQGTPWLCVLTLSQLDESSPLVSVQLGSVAPSDPNIFFPTIPLLATEDPTQLINVMDISSNVFIDAMPFQSDIQYLAHVRSVQQDEQSSNYSIVLGNRLPPTTGPCVSYLISLVGYYDFLNGGGSEQEIASYDAVRVVVLSSWSFSNEGVPQSFSDLVLALNGGLQNESLATLQIPFTASSGNQSADASVQAAFAMGYTALSHVTRLGDRTVSWYRGPLSPFQNTLNAESNVTKGADGWIRYDPTTAMYDMSYAAAWQLGQLSALSNGRIATLLAQARTQSAQQAAIERQRRTIRERCNLDDHSGPVRNSVNDFLLRGLTRFLRKGNGAL